MKKIILSILTIVTALSLYAQDNKRVKRVWADIQFAQHIGLNSWSDMDYANDGIQTASLSEIRSAINFYFRPSKFGGFVDMGLGIMPAPKMRSFNLDRMPMPHMGTQYYLREMISQSGPKSASAHFKIGTGVFGEFKATENLIVMPYLGIGGLTMARRSYEMILKEEGSNTQYNTIYTWGNNSDENSNVDMLGYLNARLNFKYKLNKRSSLSFGLEYTYFLNTIDLHARYANTFNGNIQRRIKVEGNNMNMLGISVGISFR